MKVETLILILYIIQAILISLGFIGIYQWYSLSWEVKKRKRKSTSEIEKERLILKTAQMKEDLSKIQS